MCHPYINDTGHYYMTSPRIFIYIKKHWKDSQPLRDSVMEVQRGGQCLPKLHHMGPALEEGLELLKNESSKSQIQQLSQWYQKPQKDAVGPAVTLPLPASLRGLSCRATDAISVPWCSLNPE